MPRAGRGAGHDADRQARGLAHTVAPALALSPLGPWPRVLYERRRARAALAGPADRLGPAERCRLALRARAEPARGPPHGHRADPGPGDFAHAFRSRHRAATRPAQRRQRRDRRWARSIASRQTSSRAKPQAFAPRVAHLPKPHLGVLVGGANAAYRFGAAETARLAAALRSAIDARGGSLLVTPSRRTGEANTALLRKRLEDVPAFIWNGEGANPYFGILGLADAARRHLRFRQHGLRSGGGGKAGRRLRPSRRLAEVRALPRRDARARLDAGLRGRARRSCARAREQRHGSRGGGRARVFGLGMTAIGGWGGIRTHETLAGLPVFKTGAFNRSATHPALRL